jgi:hypothetical protein
MPPVFLVGDFFGMTMTYTGRLFGAGSFVDESTYEYTHEIDFVRLIDHAAYSHPGGSFVVQVYGLSAVGYDRMWWNYNESSSTANIRRTRMVEGNLDGQATGRIVTLNVTTDYSQAPWLWAGAWDPTRSRFMFADSRYERLLAFDSLGQPVAGYPRPLLQYPSGFLGRGLSLTSFGGNDSSDVWLDVPVFLAGEDGNPRRVVVTDVYGNDLGLETPVPPMPAGWRAGLDGSPVRSRLDPNGVMYGFFDGFGEGSTLVWGLFAWRPMPIPPTWLTLSHWMGTIPAGGTSELSLTFSAAGRPAGEYRSTLVVEDTAGVVLASVPLTLVVQEATPATEPGAGDAGAAFAVSPNPVAGRGAVTVTLARPAANARVTVHDVLGREVTLLHAGALPAGATRLTLAAGELPLGMYVVRAAGIAGAARIFTVAR